MHPGINVVTKLLGQFNCIMSIRHLNSLKYVLQYLRSISSYDIWFIQGDERLQGNASIPSIIKDEKLLTFINLNLDAQDASAPQPNETRTVDMEEM